MAEQDEKIVKARESAQEFAAAITPPVPQSNTDVSMPIVGNPTVIDGDTLNFGLHKVRLYGVDAFELNQRCGLRNEIACGVEATLALKSIIGRSYLVCVRRGPEVDGLTPAVCRLGINDINAQLVRTGWAVAYRKTSNDYIVDEEAARTAKAGAWLSSFRWPWDYRAEARSK